MYRPHATTLGPMRNLFTHPRRLPLIAPSILSADFCYMGDDCRHVLAPSSPPKAGPLGLSRSAEPLGAGADLLHIDVMDGHFVPNLTMGPDMVKSLRRNLPEAFLDVHLMVTDPWLHAQAFAKAGADHITFHVEVVNGPDLGALARRIRELDNGRGGAGGGGGLTVGLAINPPTPASAAMPYLELFDLILVMSVNPGFSGQAFIPDVLQKTKLISDELSPLQRLQMDGGINQSTIDSVLDAGCDTVVAASAIFGLPRDQRARAVRALKGRPDDKDSPKVG